MSVGNKFRTLALFKETASRPTDNPQYSLEDFHKLFIDLGDETGYKLALSVLGSYEHWEALMKCEWFAKEVRHWRSELAAKLESEALTLIRSISKAPEDKNSFAAAKYLADRHAKTAQRPRKAGRPSNEEVEGELKKAALEAHSDRQDAERIGLKLVVSN